MMVYFCVAKTKQSKEPNSFCLFCRVLAVSRVSKTPDQTNCQDGTRAHGSRILGGFAPNQLQLPLGRASVFPDTMGCL